jgi:hypothetical protein
VEERHTEHQKTYIDLKWLTERIAHTETRGAAEQANQRSSTLLQAAEGKHQKQIQKNTWIYRGSTPTAEEGRINIKNRRRPLQAEERRHRKNQQLSRKHAEDHKEHVVQGVRSRSQSRGLEAGRGTTSSSTATSKRWKASEVGGASTKNRRGQHQAEERRYQKVGAERGVPRSLTATSKKRKASTVTRSRPHQREGAERVPRSLIATSKRRRTNTITRSRLHQEEGAE